ncbi:MAG: hypothetical protein IKC19_07145 [Bacteroidales bacterium]|nr:hypothetical protein [Bacteroidales bacterium]
MKKLFLFGAMVCAIGMMTACKSGTGDNTAADTMQPCEPSSVLVTNTGGNIEFEEAEVIKSATFGPEDTPEIIDSALKAAGLPMHIEWDNDGSPSLALDGMNYYISDSISYICQAEEIIFNDEPWLCITYTEDVTGQYWQMMGPKRERFLWYETALISPQAEPYQMASHGVTLHRSGVDCDAMVVRYLDSGTLDTIRYTQCID